MAELGFVPMAAGGAVKAGTYTGDGTASRTINLGVTPKWVAVWGSDGIQNEDSRAYGGLAFTNHPCYFFGYPVVQITNNGFYVYRSHDNAYIHSNEQDFEYYYLYGI